jgi:hypothetical protein
VDWHVALHVASSQGGAQFYMSCIQLNVGGSGSASPATVSLPGAYKATDPGVCSPRFIARRQQSDGRVDPNQHLPITHDICL